MIASRETELDLGLARVRGSDSKADAGDIGISKAGDIGPVAKASNEVG